MGEMHGWSLIKEGGWKWSADMASKGKGLTGKQQVKLSTGGSIIFGGGHNG